MSVKEVAKRLGVSDDVVRRLLKEGHLRGYQKTLGETSPFVIYSESVDEFEQKRQIPPKR